MKKDNSAKKNIALIGMMGTFKSSAGRRLARKLGYRFCDVDDLFEREQGLTIADCFAKFGEDFFRTRENAIISGLGKSGGQVISCGGGAALNEDNMLALGENSIIVLLTASPEAIFERVKNFNNRPLLKGNFTVDTVREIMLNRSAAYKKYAQYVVDNTALSSFQTANKIYNLIGGEFL